MIRRCTGVLVVIVVALLGLGRAEVADGTQPINFTRGQVTGSGFTTANPTALEVGPDGRLYVADGCGRIQALTLNSSKAVTALQSISTCAQLQEVYGLAFKGNDASRIFVSNTVSGFGDAGQSPAGTFLGKVTRLSGAGYQTRTDIITGLPVNNSGHQTNGLAFGPDGRLYIGEGSTTNAGVVNPNVGLFQRDEVPTSSAILVADVDAGGFNGAITYSPADTYSPNVNQTGGDVSVYATGLRNPYDLVFHSNGKLYNTDNGPNPGYGPDSITCTTDSGNDVQAPDELNIIEAGKYYGFANRNRGRFDPAQCDYRFSSEPSSGTYRAPIGFLPTSSNGIDEYTYGGFGGQMQGNLLYVAWVDSELHRVILSPDGSSVVADLTLATGLTNALDVAVGPDCTIYVAEWGSSQITYFKPNEAPVSTISVDAISPPGGPIAGGQDVTITGQNFTTTAETTVSIGGVPLSNVVVHNATTIKGTTGACSMPACPTGQKDVVVTNSIGSDSLPNGYNYTAGGGTTPPIANAGPDISTPIAHIDHAHVTLDGSASADPDGFIASYVWRRDNPTTGPILSTQQSDSVQMTLGTWQVYLTVTDNDGYTHTDDVRVIVTQTAENPEPYWCFDVNGDTVVNAVDLGQVAQQFGKRFTSTGYQSGYTVLKDWNGDRVINALDLLGTAQDFTGGTPCPLLDQQIRSATVWMEAQGFQNVNNAMTYGYAQGTPYIPGQGRHMTLGGPGVQHDAIFEPDRPETLLYEPDATVPGGWRLGGAMYIIPIPLVPLVPQGFATNEDAWHYHEGLCQWNNGGNAAQNTTQEWCLAQPGNPIWREKAGWLLHLWNFRKNPVGRFVEINEGF